MSTTMFFCMAALMADNVMRGVSYPEPIWSTAFSISFSIELMRAV